MRIRNTVVAGAAVGALFTTLLGGCSGASSVGPEDIDQLTSRIEEMERTNGRLRIRLQDTEERLFLLQDRVEANRINVARRDTDSFQRVRERTIEPTQRRFESPVTSAAPPPFPNVDPLVPNLPVQRLGPNGGAQATAPPTVNAPARASITIDGAPVVASAAPTGSMEEVVIDQAAFDARFADEGGGNPRRASSAPLIAQPPVDVGRHRLPTQDESDNRVVAPDTSESPLEIYRAAVEQFNDAEYEQALSTLNRFVAVGPEADYMDNALYWMGECLYGLGRYNEALGFFQRVASEYPDGNKVPDSLLKEALTYERLANGARARDILSTLVETYPTTDAAERARQRIRDLE